MAVLVLTELWPAADLARRVVAALIGVLRVLGLASVLFAL